jgi:cytidylate kinase
MSDASAAGSALRVVTISREYGSGGGEVAARLAKSLDWQLVDHALVERVAGEIGASLEEAEAHDEQTQGQIAATLANLTYAFPGAAGAMPADTLLSTAEYRAAFERLVRAAAERGNAVIVGRAGQVILAGRPEVMHVRIVAPFERRVAYVMRREGRDRRAAEARVRQKDRDRIRYLEREYHHRPDEAALYDLVLNTARLGLDEAVAVVRDAMRAITAGLAAGAAEAEVAAGLGRYPAAPEDFPVLPPEQGV